MVRRVIYETVLIIIIALALAAGSHALRPEALSLTVQEPPAGEDNQAKLPYKLVSIQEAEKLYTNKSAIFADARSYDSYMEGHIAGAIHLDPNEFDQWSEQLVEKYPAEQTFVTYCSGPQCALARNLAEKLTWLGFEKVYFLTDGWGQWQIKQLPVVNGEG